MSKNKWGSFYLISIQYCLTLESFVNMANRSLNDSSKSLECLPLQEHLQLLQFSFGLGFEIFIKVIVGINGLSAVLSAILNSLFILTIAKTPELRKASNYILLGLVCSDFGVAILSQPAYCIMKYAEFTSNTSLFCSSGYVFTLSAWSFATISFATLTTITADRYLAITLHLRYREVVTTTRCCLLLLSIWIFCGIVGPVVRLFGQTTFALCILCFIFVTLLCLNAFFLVKISLEIRRHSRQIKRDLPSTEIYKQMCQGRKSLSSMYYIILAFLVCYVPYSGSLIFLIFTQSSFTNFLRCVFTVTETLVMLNGVLNPIIYCSKSGEIREAVFNLLRRKKRTEKRQGDKKGKRGRVNTSI